MKFARSGKRSRVSAEEEGNGKELKKGEYRGEEAPGCAEEMTTEEAEV